MAGETGEQLEELGIQNEAEWLENLYPSFMRCVILEIFLDLLKFPFSHLQNWDYNSYP